MMPAKEKENNNERKNTIFFLSILYFLKKSMTDIRQPRYPGSINIELNLGKAPESNRVIFTRKRKWFSNKYLLKPPSSNPYPIGIYSHEIPNRWTIHAITDIPNRIDMYLKRDSNKSYL